MRLGFLAIISSAVFTLSTNAFAECKGMKSLVYAEIHRHLDNGFKAMVGNTNAEAISYARAQAISARDSYPRKIGPFKLNGRLFRERNRNAEYFLQGLYAATSDDVDAKIWITGFPEAYDAFKWIAHELRDRQIFPWMEQWLRDDPSIPTTRPGGAEWARLGLELGKDIPGSTRVTKSNEHGLQVPCRPKQDENVKRNTSNGRKQPGAQDVDGFFDSKMRDKIDEINDRNFRRPKVDIIDEHDPRYGRDWTRDDEMSEYEMCMRFQDDAPGSGSPSAACRNYRQ